MKRESGHGVLLTLLVLVVMMTALGLLASTMGMSMMEDKRSFRTVSVIAMSDAVMAETLAELSQNHEFEGVEERAFGQGVISSSVHPSGSSRVEVMARASYGGQRRTTRALVALSEGAPTVLSWRRVH